MHNIHLDHTPFFFLPAFLSFFPSYSIYFHRSWKPWKQLGFLSCWQQSQSFLPPSFLCFRLDSNPSLTGCCHLSCWLQALQDDFPDLVLGLAKSRIMTKAWNAMGISTRIDFRSHNFGDKKNLFCNHREILLFHSSLPWYPHSAELYLSSGFLYSGLKVVQKVEFPLSNLPSKLVEWWPWSSADGVVNEVGRKQLQSLPIYKSQAHGLTLAPETIISNDPSKSFWWVNDKSKQDMVIIRLYL